MLTKKIELLVFEQRKTDLTKSRRNLLVALKKVFKKLLYWI